MVFVWIAATIAFIIVEAATTQLVTIWFAIGSAAATIAALLKADTLVQFIVFVAVSLIALIITRPLVKKLTKQKFSPTNADRFVGETAVVTQAIDNIAETGLVKLQGTVWTARTADGSVIAEGEKVTVKAIEGVKLIVEKAALPAGVITQ
ncbi:MAG: NfeD family protein [Clostridia bacterium]|nr:NfeD family protein [Clostridia bacterium]